MPGEIKLVKSAPKKELSKFASFGEAGEKAIELLLNGMKDRKTTYAGGWLERFGGIIKSD